MKKECSISHPPKNSWNELFIAKSGRGEKKSLILIFLGGKIQGTRIDGQCPVALN